MYRGGLRVAGDDERRAAMRLQILRDRGDPGGVLGDDVRPGHLPRRHADAARDGACDRLDVARTHGEAMVGVRAGDRERALHGVEAVQGTAVARAAAAGELARVADVAGAAGDQVGVEDENDVGLLKVVDGVDVGAEREPRADARAVAANRLPLMPARLRQLGEERLDLGCQRR